jgi:hypothetical protein
MEKRWRRDGQRRREAEKEIELKENSIRSILYIS